MNFNFPETSYWNVLGSIFLIVFCLMAGTSRVLSAQNETEMNRPNILWLVSEDNSPLIGAYGDDFATTPNIDKLAEQGFLYTQAYANAPVCAPARNTIITGVYANSGGNQHMRSRYKVSDAIRFFPQLLREAGYYAANNAKEDYNIAAGQTEGIWDESSGEAHYKNREPGQPFFAVFNNHQTHESSIHNPKPAEELRHNPGEVALPPYHPDTPEIRRDWAQYYDNIEDMDSWVGEKLRELEESGLAENTIVFYYGDHGGVLPRSKRYVYETGTRVPFIVRIPEKYRHLWPADRPGTSVDRLISFADLAPTLLSITGITIPGFMQGEAFLGDQKTPDPEYAYMFRGRMDERYDMSRAVRDRRFRYIRNYMPHRIYGQPIEYLWRAASVRSWEKTCLEGNCNEVQNRFWRPKPVEELYDTENDPWEVHNLASDPAYGEILERMREANREWMLRIRDSGFIPEADFAGRAGKTAIYDHLRKRNIPLERIIDTAERATLATKENLPELISFLKSGDSAIRYWGALGLLLLGEEAKPAVEDLKKALEDPSPVVAATASETLYGLGETSAAREGFREALGASNPFARTYALNAVRETGDRSREVRTAVAEMLREQDELSYQNYDQRAAVALLQEWGEDLTEYGIIPGW